MLTVTDVRRVLRREIGDATQKEWATRNGISAQYLGDVLWRGKAPGPAIEKALGLKRVVGWVRR